MSSPTRKPQNRARPQGAAQCAGYTLIGLLIVVSILLISSMATLNVAEFSGRRAAEAELIEIGGEFNQAFQSYYEQSPPGTPNYPAALADLIKDPRFAGVKRHLRRLYRDPFTSKAEWGIIKAPQGGIMGVYSLAEGEPIMQGRPYTSVLDVVTPTATNSYARWRFGYVPETKLGNGQGKAAVPPGK